MRILNWGDRKTMKKLLLSAAVLAIFTGGMTVAVNFAAPETAVACAYDAQTPSAALAASLPQVRHGDKGKHVLALQLALRTEGYTYLRGTGTYASETLRAVKDFQRKNHIKDSGIVGPKTWHALVATKPPSSTGGAPGSIEVFSLRPGERNEMKVSMLTHMLFRIHPYLTEMPTNSGDVYGPELQKIVRDFQKRAGIKASGIVGPKTVRAMDTVIAVSGNWGC
ncbi:peptidoglycan-binding protein [Actinophytocola sp.]|uniref:peptidoglycan-binding protein n=1 Tax=Actinophytocola sp. TaxID=1872138 RepID=UPI002ED5A799